MNVVGKRIRRIDALDKLLGKAIYADDLEFENMLYAKVLRSPLAHAMVKSIDIRQAEKLNGVRAVLTAKDIPGENRVISVGIFKDQPALVDDKVRCVGDPIAIVAADSEEIASEAVKLINVQYEELEPAFDPVEAMSVDAPRVHDRSNILSHLKIRRGDIGKGFEESDIVIEGSYKTPFHYHAFMEPQAGIAAVDSNGNVTVWTCVQGAYHVREEVARVLGLSLNKVRVIQTVTGGGFGGKTEISVQCHIALLAFKTGRPVKMVFTREESILTTVKRHPFIINYKTGANKDGKLLAVEVKIIGDTGAYANTGVMVLMRAAIHATGPYNVPNVKVDAYTVYTNNPVCGALRGFGEPQIAMAHEAQMDKLAKELGIDPIELRLKNAFDVGSVTPNGQVLTQSVGIKKTLQNAQEVAKQWRHEIQDKDSRKRRGVGVGVMWYGVGNTGHPNPSSAVVNLLSDGSAVVSTCCAEIGQGSDTVLAQIAAEELGIDVGKINMVTADTLVAPEARTTTASGQTYITGNAVRLAAIDAKDIVLRQVATDSKVELGDLYFDGGFVRFKDQPAKKISVAEAIKRCRDIGTLTLGQGLFNPITASLDPETGQGQPYGTYSFATHVAEVEVDTETGEVTVLKYVACNDVGKAINPALIEGQLEGGLSMGLGQALMENLIVDKGMIRTPNLAQYLIPTSLDVPDEVVVSIVEDREPSGPFGAKGVGEMASIPTIPAILSAIDDAVGVRIDEIPATSERVFYLIKKALGEE